MGVWETELSSEHLPAGSGLCAQRWGTSVAGQHRCAMLFSSPVSEFVHRDPLGINETPWVLGAGEQTLKLLS